MSISAPTDIANCVLWLKADAGAYNDAGVTLATDGQTVRQWNDQSGSGNHASQSTSGNRPTYVTNQINSLPVIRFDGSNDALTTGLTTAFGDFSAFVVFKRRGAGVSYPRLIDKAYDTGFWIGEYGGGVANWFGGGIRETTGNFGHFYSAYNASVHMVGMVRSGTTKYLLGDWLEVSETCSSTACGTSAVTIGADVWAGSQFNGDICEVVIYSDDLTAQQRADVQEYLCNRWAVATAKSERYVMACFDLADNTIGALRICSSNDGTNFTLETSYYKLPTASGGDYSMTYFGGKYWLAHTRTRDPGVEVHQIELATSTNGRTWTQLRTLDCSSITGSTVARAWAPEWLIDDDNTLKLTVTLSDNALGNLRQYRITTADSTWATGGTFNELTGIGAGYIDGFVLPPGRSPSGTYDMLTKNQATGKYIERWQSSTLGGTFSGISTGNALALGTPREGPCVYRLPSGSWRMLMDEDSATLGLLYSDSSNGWATWTTPAAISGTFPFTPRHGTVLDTFETFVASKRSRRPIPMQRASFY